MAEIGIVSVHKTNKFKYKFFCGIEISECTDSYIPCLNAVIFMSEKCCKRSDKNKFLALFKKAEKKLKKRGVTAVYKTVELSAVCGESRNYKIPSSLISRVFLTAKSVCDTTSALPRIAIKTDSSIDLKRLLSDIVMYVGQVEIYTDDAYSANSAADFIFEKFGVIADVYDISDYASAHFKYVIDTTDGFVRIGDFKADGVVLGLTTGDERVDLDRIFDRHESVNITNKDAIKLLSEFKCGTRDIYIKKILCGGRAIALNADSV